MHLSGSVTKLYFISGRKSSDVTPHRNEFTPNSIDSLVDSKPHVPWVLLADQSEEIFWGDAMPLLSGRAKETWLQKVRAQTSLDTPFRWAQMQNPSKANPDKMRTLGYALGRKELILPWLVKLQEKQALIRGLYSPILLASAVCAELKINKKAKGQDTDQEIIQVICTPHADGLRQCVMIGGYLRFARLALRQDYQGANVYKVGIEETEKLREYLISKNFLKSENTGLNIAFVLPDGASKEQAEQAESTLNRNRLDQYSWFNVVQPERIFIRALAATQSWDQMTPSKFRWREIAFQYAKLIKIWAVIVFLGLIVALGFSALNVFNSSDDLSKLKEREKSASAQYKIIAATFPDTNMTSTQLLTMQRRWNAIQQKYHPDIRDMLAFVGTILSSNPQVVLESLEWTADIGGFRPEALSQEAKSPQNNTTVLAIRGAISGLQSSDLRAVRDTINKFTDALGKDPRYKLEIIRIPLDLGTTTTIQGSGKQEKQDTNFDIKIWLKSLEQK